MRCSYLSAVAGVPSSLGAVGQTAELLAELPAEHSGVASCPTDVNGYRSLLQRTLGIYGCT